MLRLTTLSKEFGDQLLLKEVSWHVKRGDHVALVGDNGAGKSTLMRIMAGIEEPSAGKVIKAKECRVAYLPQDGIVTQGVLLFHEVKSGLKTLLSLEQELHHLGEALAALDPASEAYTQQLERYGAAQEHFKELGGYRVEADIATVLHGLGFSQDDGHRDCKEFSGGWQMRIALAKLLLARPDILLLDEPTNHLDLDARNWLEQYLQSYQGAVVLVSHDRLFMDKVCSRTVEVWNQTLTEYHVPYTQYLSQREERVAALREAKRLQDEEIERLEEFINRFRYQATKASLVQSRIRQLEKIERIALPPERKHIAFTFPDAPKCGKIVFELTNVAKTYGAVNVLKSVNLTIERGEKVALVGQNGAGKSTLMALLAGNPVTDGEVTVGHNVVIDYFAQNQAEALNCSHTVYEELYEECPFEVVPRLRDILGTFLFSGDTINKSVAVLSGGERNRLALAKMLLRPANVLLLDEPTNHLDVTSKEVLLRSLRQYTGTVIFVSHDRYFVSSLATRIVEIGGGSARSYYGTYEYYLEKRQQESTRTELASASSEQALRGSDKEDRLKGREEQKKTKRQEQARDRQRQDLERMIEQYEQELHELEEAMNSPGFFDDPERGLAAGERHGELEARLEGLYLQWEEAL